MITFIYANRNRDLNRIRLSLDSLQSQKEKNFSVSFVDYGSDPKYVDELDSLLSKYPFVIFFRLNVSHLLWNKSKALNYGILQVSTPFIFIADVDLLFHQATTKQLEENCDLTGFGLYCLNYLSKEVSAKLIKENTFTDLQVERKGDVNGMILAPKKAFIKVNGYDEFFHFYGAEDVDLFDRIERAGYKRRKYPEKLFYHYWHPSFHGSDDKIITQKPRVENIMRINEQHYFMNNKLKVIRPRRQPEIGSVIKMENSDLLKTPDKIYHIKNILAQVEHFIHEVMPAEKGVICVVFEGDPYFFSVKHKVKKLLKKQTQPYLSMKEVNDMLLKKIVFEYRNANYSFKIAEDLKSIDFRIQL
ncbi:glycosyltransferase family 2 protein [Gramella sp. AN32]|uniref:Glycosyltransferase family 2 protein n=1 Tax=Christiangramia antarctica TaxID=2058158 RepID=A0ABW5X762_9FLAO|nr:glycosyltransferase family 2 protein [Gramella sp. AN32]MCM4154692.1 glycosyl transferase family 2 [Gramella sp. AN32]